MNELPRGKPPGMNPQGIKRKEGHRGRTQEDGLTLDALGQRIRPAQAECEAHSFDTPPVLPDRHNDSPHAPQALALQGNDLLALSGRNLISRSWWARPSPGSAHRQPSPAHLVHRCVADQAAPPQDTADLLLELSLLAGVITGQS